MKYGTITQLMSVVSPSILLVLLFLAYFYLGGSLYGMTSPIVGLVLIGVFSALATTEYVLIRTLTKQKQDYALAVRPLQNRTTATEKFYHTLKWGKWVLLLLSYVYARIVGSVAQTVSDRALKAAWVCCLL